MPLTAGTRLGPYEVLVPLGKGGMGEVYRAKDTKLGRDVAIKVLPDSLARDPERLARFEREAKVLASLNHPNIATIYGLEETPEGKAIAMELVDGATLTSPVPLDTALNYARQIAEALEVAHEKGITHRDLKPANIMVTPAGLVKVLDFGLASVARHEVSTGDDSPTFTMPMTEAGVVMGTPAYMAPEQAMGNPADRRADIWAFGVLLYEMLSGKRLFTGSSSREILSSVLTKEIDFDAVPEKTRRLLRRCLERDPNKRMRHIGDIDLLLEGPPIEVRAPSKNRWLWPSVAALAVAAAAVAYWAPWRGQENLQATRFQIPSTDDIRFIVGGFPAVSPNGRWIVFPAIGMDQKTRMYLRALDSVEVRPLAGTESSTDLPAPVFWSPDSRFVAFSTSGGSASGQLKKVDITGGPPQVICDVPSAVPGGAWNRDGMIVMGTNVGGLLRVSAAGGAATPMTVMDGSRKEVAHRWPQFLPDGRHFLYYRASSDPSTSGVYVGSIDAKPEEQSLKPLLLADRQAVYAASVAGEPGRLLFLRNDTLFAQSFNPDRLELSGEAVPVADQVGSFVPANAALFSVSQTGTLAYRIGGANGSRVMQLAWFDAEGKPVGNLGEGGVYGEVAIAPDGIHVAVTQYDATLSSSNVWVMDTSRGTSARLTFGRGSDRAPVWSPDGKTIIFASNRSGRSDLYQKASDGSGEERLLLKSDEDKLPTSWSKDGRFLLYTSTGPKTLQDLWVLPMEGGGKPFAFLQTEFNEQVGAFSPDGKWIAYTSWESGNPEVYVRPFAADQNGGSAGGGKWLISKGLAFAPRWRKDGKELFYVNPREMGQMAVDVTADKSFQAGIPRRLFTIPPIANPPDVSADGKRFLQTTIGGPAGTSATPFNVVLNWQAALRK